MICSDCRTDAAAGQQMIVDVVYSGMAGAQAGPGIPFYGFVCSLCVTNRAVAGARAAQVGERLRAAEEAKDRALRERLPENRVRVRELARHLIAASPDGTVRAIREAWTHQRLLAPRRRVYVELEHFGPLWPLAVAELGYAVRDGAPQYSYGVNADGRILSVGLPFAATARIGPGLDVAADPGDDTESGMFDSDHHLLDVVRRQLERDAATAGTRGPPTLETGKPLSAKQLGELSSLLAEVRRLEGIWGDPAKGAGGRAQRKGHAEIERYRAKVRRLRGC